MDVIYIYDYICNNIIIFYIIHTFDSIANQTSSFRSRFGPPTDGRILVVGGALPTAGTRACNQGSTERPFVVDRNCYCFPAACDHMILSEI